MQKQKKLTVKEIKELEPKADVYELNQYTKYLVTVRKSELDIGGKIAHQQAEIVLKTLQQAGVNAVILIGMNDDVKFMEIE